MAQINLKQKLIIFFISLMILFLMYATSLWIDNAHHDVIRHFKITNASKTCLDDPQFGWLVVFLGRPFAGLLECLIFINIHSYSDLIIWRLVVIILLALTNTFLILILNSNNIGLFRAFIISTPIFVLPGAINSVFMINISNSLSLLMSLISYYTLELSIKKKSFHNITSLLKTIDYKKISIPFLILLSVMFTYPTLSFFFFIGLLFNLLNNKIPFKTVVYKFIYNCIFFILISCFAMIIFKLLSFVRTEFYDELNLPSHIFLPLEFQTNFDINNIFNNLFLIFPNIYFPKVLTLWFFEAIYLKGLIFIFLIFSIIGFYKSFKINNNNLRVFFNFFSYESIARLILIFLLFLVTFTPLLIKGGTPQPFFRLLFVPMSFVAIIIIFYFSHEELKLKFKVSKDSFFSIKLSNFLNVFLIIAFVNISFHINKNTLGINYELTFSKNIIAGYTKPIQYIHVIRPIKNNMGYSGMISHNDEFHTKTMNFKNDEFFLIKSAFEDIYKNNKSLIWCKKDQNCLDKVNDLKSSILVSFSDYDEVFCKKENMVIINYNILVRATNTGNPKIINLEQVPFC